MKKIGSINKYDLSIEEVDKLPIQKKVRGVVFLDKDTIICVEETSYGIKNLLGLPGGTVEDNEDYILAFKREVLEETGYEINSPEFIGIIDVVRKDYVSVTYYYKAKTNGIKKDINLTPEEIEVNTQPIEINFNEAFERITKECNENPNDNSLRSLLIMKEIK